MGRKLKAVLFNDKTEAPLLKYANELPNFSAFIKDCIKEKMDPRSLVAPEMERLIADMIKKQITLYEFIPRQDNELKNDLDLCMG